MLSLHRLVALSLAFGALYGTELAPLGETLVREHDLGLDGASGSGLGQPQLNRSLAGRFGPWQRSWCEGKVAAAPSKVLLP